MTFLGCSIPGRVPTGTALGLGSFTQCLNLPGTVFVSAAVTCCSPKADRAQHMHMGRSHASRAVCLITNFYEKPQHSLALIFSRAYVYPPAGHSFIPAAICHTVKERAATALG